MNLDQYMIVTGPDVESLRTGIQDMADRYSATGFTNGIKVYQSRRNENNYVLNFTNPPDFERFKHLTNYISSPGVNSSPFRVMAYCNVSPSDTAPNEIVGKRVLLYVANGDLDGDNVHAVWDGAHSTARLGFSRREEFEELDVLEFDFAEPDLTPDDYELMDTFSPDPDKAERPIQKSSGCLGTTVLLILVVTVISLI